MVKQITFAILVCLAIICGDTARSCQTQAKQQSPPPSCRKHSGGEISKDTKDETTRVERILSDLRKAADSLRSYRAEIEYLFIQDPELINSTTLQKGMLYYVKNDKASKLKIDFQIMQQEDEEPEKRIQQFLFDGVWLTKIDYQTKTVDYYQKRPKNDPVDVFEYISHNFPMIGFAETDRLPKEFEISLPDDDPADPNALVHLHLKVKKNSIYKDDYKYIDFWVDPNIFLPARLIAVSTEDDIYQIDLKRPSLNKQLKDSVFQVDPPQNFTKYFHELKQNQ